MTQSNNIVLFHKQTKTIGVEDRVFTNGSGRVIPKTQKKWYLMPPCLTLSIIRNGSRVSEAIQGNK